MKRHLTCCVCGEDAGEFEQHWNRDTGWGICVRCVSEEAIRETPDQMLSLYGKVGINYGQPTVRHMGKHYKVLATTKREDLANAFMARTEGAAVLTVLDDGLIVIADKNDEGESIPTNE
jgi:hypothetical protein